MRLFSSNVNNIPAAVFPVMTSVYILPFLVFYSLFVYRCSVCDEFVHRFVCKCFCNARDLRSMTNLYCHALFLISHICDAFVLLWIFHIYLFLFCFIAVQLVKMYHIVSQLLDAHTFSRLRPIFTCVCHLLLNFLVPSWWTPVKLALSVEQSGPNFLKRYLL